MAPPTLIVLNKADLTGSRSGGADRRARTAARPTCRPDRDSDRRRWCGLLAVVRPGDSTTRLVEALRTLVARARRPEPPSMPSSAAEHAVSADVRARLLDRLDRFGIAHAVLALADGTDASAARRHLRSS